MANNYTFDGIKQLIKDRLSLKSSWKKTLFYGTYERIIDAVAFGIDKLVYLSEFLYKESNYETATKISSLLTKAKPLLYKSYRKKGATGIVSLSGSSTFSSTYRYAGSQVYLPRWTVMTDTNKSLSVYTIEDYYYYTGTIGSLNLSVVQGVPKQYTYVASGEDNETFTIYDNSIDNDEIEIFIVDSSGNILDTVDIVDNLYFVYNTTAYSCEVSTSLDQQSVEFKFGDNVTSRKLLAGERVLVKYAQTDGADGDINTQDIITTFQNTIYDSNGSAVTLYLTNDEAITGGSDVETLESIRENANHLFFTGYRLGSEDDWSALLASVSYVYKAIVWTISTVGGSSAVAEQNQVFITAISSDGENLTTAQQTDLIADYINAKKCLTESVSFEDFQKIYLKFEVIAKIQNKSITVMDAAIKQALEDNYGILNSDFQKSIYESNFYSVINNVEDLVHHTTTVYYIEKNVSALLSNYTVWPSYTSDYTSIAENQIYLLESTLKIWIKRKIAGTWLTVQQIGYTDTVDNTIIYGMNGYTINGGSILYSENQISYSIYSIINNAPVNLIPTASSDFSTDGTSYWTASFGTFTWNGIALQDATYTSSGSTGSNSIYKNTLTHAGLTYTITFRAKSTTLTSKPAVYLGTTLATANVQPDLTAVYQNYSFTCLAPDEVAQSLIISFGNTLAVGADVTIDDIIIIESLPSGSYGVKNPGDSDNNGYTIYLEYKTKDGNDQQINSVRIPGFQQISDIEPEDWVTTTLTYI